MKSGTLFVVATPLGNLEDITARALRVLREVGLIAAEDTRHSRKLLSHFDIHTPLVSYYDEIERQRAAQLVERLKGGESIALISDAGTPGIADPGYRLVCAAVDAGISVTPIPGPSAVAAVLSVAGLPTDRFVFEGFVPAKESARRKFFAGLASESRTIIVYEAARRLRRCLEDLVATLGGDRRVVVARELTKMFEEIVRGRASDLLARLQETTVRGEVTLVIGGLEAAAADKPLEDLETAIEHLKAAGRHTREIAEQLAPRYGLSRREVYERIVRGRG